jgi:hypothetical protein
MLEDYSCILTARPLVGNKESASHQELKNGKFYLLQTLAAKCSGLWEFKDSDD